MSTDSIATKITSIEIPFLKLDRFFVVRPKPGEMWLSKQRLPGRFTPMGICLCGGHVYLYAIKEDVASQTPAHTVIRCSGDYGCKNRVVFAGVYRTFGELIIGKSSLKELIQTADMYADYSTCASESGVPLKQCEDEFFPLS